MDVSIRKALCGDSNVLTDISFKSKRYWNYPEEYFEVWKDELTIKDSYILKNTVYVAEANGKIIGYYSVVEVKNDFWTENVFVMKGFWLEHIFILPEYIGKGIGTKLIKHLRQTCKILKCRNLYIFSDPNSKGFYDKIGAKYIKECPSNIEGRTVLLYKLNINSKLQRKENPDET